jgi:hypothetical protein
VTIWIAVLVSLVAVAAAVRSTWSPCGLSMLSTITPLSERAKGHSYRSTVSWFILGSTVGGATLGALMALGAAGVGSLDPAPATLGATALGAALVAAASDSGVTGVRLPIHRRQVNERWLDHYRSWVYGAGFGWQIGSGVSTYITTSAVYLMIVLGALTTEPVTALAAGTGFGVVRGVAVLMTRHLEGPSDLLTFHRRFMAVGPSVQRGVVVVELVVAAVVGAAVGATTRSPVALGVVVSVVLAVALIAAAAAAAAARSVATPGPGPGVGSDSACGTPPPPVARPVSTVAE